MIVKNDIKQLEKGDKITCKGICAEIAKITYQDYDAYTDTFIVEFYDSKGNLRNWHQNSDGGTVIAKPDTKEIWVGFEKRNSTDDNNFNNYDAMKTFETERDAMDWRNDNIDYRQYKYCGKVAI